MISSDMSQERFEKANRKYLKTKKKAWRYLRKGLLFLIISLAIGQIVDSLQIRYHELITESATIAAWVGVWKPMEMFLYDLPELKKQKDSYKV